MATLTSGLDLAALHELVTDLHAYATLPFVLFRGDPAVANAVNELPGVSGVAPAVEGAWACETLVRGFDLLGQVFMIQQSTPGGVDVVGGSVSLPATAPALIPVINMSIGPSSHRYPFIATDPINLATQALAANMLVVAAAGNDGPGTRETVSAWAEPSWVVSVGATADPAGERLLASSSRGVRNDPQSGPDVVAYGASALDQSRFGTSFAAPRVTFCAMVIAAVYLHVQQAWNRVIGMPEQGISLVGYGIIDEGFPAGRPMVPADGLGQSVIATSTLVDALAAVRATQPSFSVHGSPTMLRRLLLAAARPIDGVSSHQVGAGFLSQELVVDYLASSSIGDVIGWFADVNSTHVSSGADRPAFDRSGLESLVNEVDLTYPTWRYDHQTRELTVIGKE